MVSAHSPRAYFWLPGGEQWRARIVARDEDGRGYTAEMLARRERRLAREQGSA